MAKQYAWYYYGLLLLSATCSFLPRLDAQPLFWAAQKPEAFDAVDPDLVAENNIDVIEVEDAYWAWIPRDRAFNVGLIYYTELWYDERAYAPIMNRVASSRYPTFLLDIQWSMPFLSPFRADLVLRDYPDIEYWVVAGHGVGGAIASVYAQRRRDKGVDGLGLFASYPFPIFNDQSMTDIKVTSIWGNRDSITTRLQWEDGRSSYPRNAKFKEIEGANHGQMGRLAADVQDGDRRATIDRDTQETIVVQELIDLLEWVETGTKQPTAMPSSSPTVTQPTAMPSSSPTVTPAARSLSESNLGSSETTTRTIASRLGFRLDFEATIRQPTNAEVQGVLDQTEGFYVDLFRRKFPDMNLMSLEITNVSEIFQPEVTRLPFLYDFDIVVVFSDTEDAAPTDQELFDAIKESDETVYIADHVHKAEPAGGIFANTIQAPFTFRGGAL